MGRLKEGGGYEQAQKRGSADIRSRYLLEWWRTHSGRTLNSPPADADTSGYTPATLLGGGESIVGCDEDVGKMVVDALMSLLGMGWVTGSAAQSSQTSVRERTGTSRRTNARRRETANRPQDLAAHSVTKNAPASLLPQVTNRMAEAIDGRIEEWHRSGNTVAAGNLGEQVALRVLKKLGYQIMATQEDLKGAVPSILGHFTRMNPEDFVVVKDGLLMTVNSKASMTAGSSTVTRSGDLGKPTMSKGQATEQYYATRAGLFSPLTAGAPFAQVIKVDLIHKQAQIFNISEEGKLTPVGRPMNVLREIVTICAQFPFSMPAPEGAWSIGLTRLKLNSDDSQARH